MLTLDKQPFTTFRFQVSADSTYQKYDSTYVMKLPFDSTNTQRSTMFSIVLSTKQDTSKAIQTKQDSILTVK